MIDLKFILKIQPALELIIWFEKHAVNKIIETLFISFKNTFSTVQLQKESDTFKKEKKVFKLIEVDQVEPRAQTQLINFYWIK